MRDPDPNLPQHCTAFEGSSRIASGPLAETAIAVKRRMASGTAEPFLTFDDRTAQVIDLDLRGSDADVAARYSPAPPVPRSPGRPKLGVIAREVTLLPRHWEWLNRQPGGASVALRKLVEEARRNSAGADRQREAAEAAYRFIAAMAGDRPGFEEAARALFGGDAERFAERTAGWPADIRTYATALAFGDS